MKKAELEAELEKAQRKLAAYFEWTQSVCHHEPVKVVELCLQDAHDVSVSVFLRRLTRSSGGVAVVHTVGTDWFDEPEHVDRLVSRWLADPSRDIREAAKQIRAIQVEANL